MDNMQKSNNTYHIELSSFEEAVIDEYEVCQLTVSKNGERLERLSVWGEDPSNGEFEPYYICLNEEEYLLSDLIQVTDEATQAIEDYVKDGKEFKLSIKEGINSDSLDEMNWSNHQESEEKQYQDAEIVYVSTPGIYSDTKKEDVYQVENVKSTEVKMNDAGTTIQEVKTTPNVDRRYLGTDEIVFNEKQEEDKKREEARRRHIMQQMDGRDY